jgi:ABC-2 type transport system permease protein
MRIIDIAIKDWTQIFRDWKSGLFLVLMPILFTLFFGIVLSPALNPAPAGDARLPVGVIYQGTESDIARNIETLLGASSAVRPVQLTKEQASEAASMVADGEVAAAIVVPAGYFDALLSGENAQLEVIVDQSTPAGQTASTAIETAVNRLRSAAETAHLSTEAYTENAEFDSEIARRDYMMSAFTQAVEAWSQPPISTRHELATGEDSADTANGLTGFTQASSGMIVQFAIFGLITSAMVLVLERKTRALQRLLTTPTRRWEIISGHMLAMFTIVFLQQVLLVGFGELAFDVGYLRQPLAVLVMMVALAAWSASLGMLISAIAKGEEQVITLSLIAMFLFASLGGAWFPLDVAGETFSKIGHLMPTAWAMDGFQNLIVRGLGLNSVILPAGILGLYAVGFFALALWRFRFE